ncbi:MAG: ABC transporter ATP-binding protein [Halanaerobiaceae bacterium]
MASFIPFMKSKKDLEVEEKEVFLKEGEIPLTEKKKVAHIIPSSETIKAIFLTDLTQEGKFATEWVVLTDQKLYNLGTEPVNDTGIISIKLEEISEIGYKLLEGNQIVKIRTPQSGKELFRCSQKQEVDCQQFVDFLDEVVQEKTEKKESLVQRNKAFARGKTKIKKCPKCGKPISHWRNICNECLDKRKLIFRLLQYIKPHLIPVFLGFLFMGLATFIGQLPPLLSRSLTDDVFVPATGAEGASQGGGGIISDFFLNFGDRGTVELLMAIVIAMLVINILRSVFDTIRSYIVQWLGQRVIVDMRNQVYEHLQKLSLSFFNKESTGRLMARVTSDVNRLESFLSRDVQRLGQDIFTLVVIIGILFSLSVRLTLIVMIPAPFLVYLTMYFRNKLHRVYRILWRKNAGLSSILADTIPGIRVVKAFTQENREIKKFNEKNQELYQGQMESIKLRTAYNPTMQFLTFLGTILIWWFGGLEVLEGNLSLGTLIAFTGYMWTFYRPVQDLCRMNHRFQRTATSADRVFEVLDTEPELRDAEDAVSVGEIEGKVAFENVTFSYDRGTPALKNVSFSVEPGEVIGLAGRSGAGKSTMINLICRFYDPEEGKVLVDGYDLKEISTKSLRQQIGIVLQDPFLFAGSIAENIIYGKQDASRHEVIAAAKAANAHQFIMEFSDGYETQVGERGVRISTGQRQRISIARALLKDPRLLILDEATSSVDTQTEAEIQEALERLVEGRTTFAIAHRLSTLKNADRLFILDDGEIVETGTHDELLEEDGVYATMYNMQREMQAV